MITRRAAGFWLRHNSRRYASPEGGARLIGAVQDVTAERTREAELKKALDELHRLREQLQGENMYLRQESQRTFGAKQVVGRSPAIRSALALAEQVAATNATVLLTGETGTGKERFARSSTSRARGAAARWSRINCARDPRRR